MNKEQARQIAEAEADRHAQWLRGSGRNEEAVAFAAVRDEYVATLAKLYAKHA